MMSFTSCGDKKRERQERRTHSKLAVCNIPTTFLTIDNSSSGTFIHSLNAAIKAVLTSLPGAEER